MGRHLKYLLSKGVLAGKLYSEQWFAFEDENGPGYAQADHFVVGEAKIWLFECKLTQTVEAYGQLFSLYAPLLSRLFPGRTIVCVQVFKNWRYTAESVNNLADCRVGALNCWNLRV